MGLFLNKSFEAMDDVFMEQLEDLYDAEIRLTKALPKLAKAAQMSELKAAFNSHLAETEQHVERLERIFKSLGKEPKREACEGIKGLISEGSEMISANGGRGVKDAALIAAAQRVEHYEMAGYGTARSMAEHLGHDDAAKLLQKTLDEEGAADKKLTSIAESSIYKSKAPKSAKSTKSAQNRKSHQKPTASHAGNGRKATKGNTRSGKSKRGKRAMA